MTDRMEHLDEGTIHAWLDGALSPDESARVESHANSCTDCSALVAEARGLVAASSRILASLDAVPAGVVPGSGTDQLAALRARRQAATRVWWRDRRWVAAASLILVAGVSSVVWRFSGEESVTVGAVHVADSVLPVITAPSAAPVAAFEAKAEASQPQQNVASDRAAGSSAPANAKVAAVPPPNAPAEPTAESRATDRQARDVANRARLGAANAAVATAQQQQSTDSTKALAREQSAFERKVQQTVQSVPTPPRIIPEPEQQGAARAPASPTPLAARNRSAADAAFSAGLRPTTAKSAAVGCYRLTLITPGEMHRTLTMEDTLQLLDEPTGERSDPSWSRARYLGERPDSAGVALAWRVVDSTTVELRTVPDAQGVRVAAYLLRFRALPSGGQPPDVTGLTNVRAASAVRVECR